MNIKKVTSVRGWAFAFAAVMALAVEARVLFMTPEGAGEMDGTSWANAWKGSDPASFSSAYTNASRGATADAPNEIWMKFGKYMLWGDQLADGIPIQPNVIVRGGFLGSETSADAADPKSNPTVLCNNYFDENETWRDGSKIWTHDGERLVFADPPADEGWGPEDQGVQCAFSHRDATVAMGVAEFHGLTFTKFWSSAILVAVPNDRPIVIRNCRFLNMGRLMNNGRFMVDLTDVGLDMDGCEFVAGRSPVMVRTTATDSKRCAATIRNSRIFATKGSWNTQGLGGGSGGVLALNNVALTIAGCTFDSIASDEITDGPTDAMASALSVHTMADVLVEDTVVSRGHGQTRRSGGAFVYRAQGDGALTVRRSRFEDCRFACKSWLAHETAAAAVTLHASLADGRTPRVSFEGVAFVGNQTTNMAENCETASCVAFGSNNYGEDGYWKADFVNCLFERNEAFNAWTSGPAGATICCSWTQAPRPVFVNCVFKDNICGMSAEDGSRMVSQEVGNHPDGDKLRFAFVNTIFANTAKTAIPWDEAHAGYVSLANVVIDSGATMATTRPGRYRYAPCLESAAVSFMDELFTNGVVVARRLSNASAYRRKGRPVWAGTDGECYLRDADGDAENPWRSCRYGGSRLSDEAAREVGVSLTADPVADAFGTARSAKRCALGQLELPRQGLCLIVR